MYGANGVTVEEFLAETRDSYLPLIHLVDGVEEAVATIAASEHRASRALIEELLCDGDSWRERLLGLVAASLRGVGQFYDQLIVCMYRTRGLSIVPTCAALSVAVRDHGCNYETSMTATLDRELFDGEIGFALDWLHHAIGIREMPRIMQGPNSGQVFPTHLDFYASLGPGGFKGSPSPNE